MRIEDLIEEGEFLGTTMTKSPVPSNIMGIGDWYYAFPDSVGYWAWTNKCIISKTLVKSYFLCTFASKINPPTLIAAGVRKLGYVL